MFDDFTATEHDGDGKLLALFREWSEARLGARDARLDDDDEAVDRAFDKADAIEEAIYKTPGTGPVGLAIKGYFLGFSHGDRDYKIDRAFGEPGDYGDDGLLKHYDSRAIKSFVDDAIRFVPELRALVGHIADAPFKLRRLDDAGKTELRARAEAMAAEYDTATLPEGDAGLIEAERRIRELEAGLSALGRDFPEIDSDIEEQIILPTVLAANTRLIRFIEETPPQSPAGAAVKLRDVLEHGVTVDDVSGSLSQVLEFIEREARP
jgi:hypothetical protein